MSVTATLSHAPTVFGTLATLPLASRESALIASIFTERFLRLSPADRSDIIALLQASHPSNEPADFERIQRAIHEILAGEPVTATRLDLTPTPLEGRRKSWAVRVGKEIRRHREAAGLTQTQLAERAGLPQSHISRLENAEHSATRMTLEKIATALGIEVNQLDLCVTE